MKYHELNTRNRKTRTRAGRGISAGRGKTAGRGTKGQNSRSGGKRRPGFEGGQNPLYMRLPKLPGFKSKRRPVQQVTTDELNLVSGKDVDNQTLAKDGIIKDAYLDTKLIKGSGPLSKSFSVSIQAASAGAISAVEAAGGSVKLTPRPSKKAKSAKTDK